ncbi:uncharacterized protein LOC143298637 [Babylonia areolata]|uniref:uncharacterized protein LOC143298637 n=1 Tax=Babylonia areolata TaxID=304850 RepID=UPI003FD32998
MFARKGTTVRRGRRSVRRPRTSVQGAGAGAGAGAAPAPLSPAPSSSATSSSRPRVEADPESGDVRSGSPGDLGRHRTSSVVSGAPTVSSSTSLTSSLPVLNDDRSIMCRSSSNFSEDKFQHTSYGSILYQLREVQDEATDVCDYLQRVFEVAWDSLVLTVVMVLLLGMPIAMIAVGSSYEHECPREPRIPIYLLVGGSFGTIHLVILLWQQKKSRDYNYPGDDDDDDFDDGVMSRSCRFTCYMLSAFLLVWFVLGNIWVLGVWQPNFQQPLHDPQNWCHRVVFFFSFYQLLAVYGLMGLVLLVVLLVMFVFLVRRRLGQ